MVVTHHVLLLYNSPERTSAGITSTSITKTNLALLVREVTSRCDHDGNNIIQDRPIDYDDQSNIVCFSVYLQ